MLGKNYFLVSAFGPVILGRGSCDTGAVMFYTEDLGKVMMDVGLESGKNWHEECSCLYNYKMCKFIYNDVFCFLCKLYL